MVRYRMRIVLLSLGVLWGYGSAFSHFHHHHDHRDHRDRYDRCDPY